MESLEVCLKPDKLSDKKDTTDEDILRLFTVYKNVFLYAFPRINRAYYKWIFKKKPENLS